MVDKLEKSMSKIADIEGIGPAYAEKLKSAGIDTVEELLEAGASKKGREDIAAKSEITEKLILEWVNKSFWVMALLLDLGRLTDARSVLLKILLMMLFFSSAVMPSIAVFMSPRMSFRERIFPSAS